MNWTIEFMPLVPASILIGATVLAAIISLMLLWFGRRGAFLRIFSLALLVLALANPNLMQEQRETLPNIVVVVTDNSTSQTLGGRQERTAELKAQVAEALKAIPNLDVRFLDSARGGSPGKEETTLFADLNRGLADVPPDRLAGVLFITDGQIHDVPSNPASLNLGAPIHTLITGIEGERDDRIEVVSAPRFGLVGSEQTAEIKIERNGPAGKGSQIARLKIHRENEPEESITARYGDTVKIRFPFKHAGPTIMEVELEPQPGELTLVNNRAVIAAEGVRENLRVLLVSGEPHAGERTWRNLLRSDASVDLVHFTILRPPEKQDGTPPNQLSLIAFPTRELFSEKLHEFDLIIFDRYQRKGILPLIYLDNVARYVEQGGAVLVAAGADFAATFSLSKTPLGDVLPAKPTGRVVEEPFRPLVTAAGFKHPVTSGLPGAGSKNSPPNWGRWFRTIEASPVNGEVVMTGAEGHPLLVLSRFGEGRVAVLLSDHAWLWARGFDGGGPHADLLRRLAHWLMKEPDLEEEWLRASGEEGRLTIERRSMKDKLDPATVTSPSGKTQSVTLDDAGGGLWRKTIEAKETGVYRVNMDALSSIAVVGNLNSREFAKVVATAGPIKPVADTTGGGIFWMGAGNEPKASLPRITLVQGEKRLHGQNWLGLKDRDPHLVRGVTYIPLFEGFAALALLIGLFGFTWYREGR